MVDNADGQSSRPYILSFLFPPYIPGVLERYSLPSESSNLYCFMCYPVPNFLWWYHFILRKSENQVIDLSYLVLPQYLLFWSNAAYLIKILLLLIVLNMIRLLDRFIMLSTSVS